MSRLHGYRARGIPGRVGRDEFRPVFGTGAEEGKDMTQHQIRQYDDHLGNGQAMLGAPAEPASRPDANDQHKALLVLTMAQRTAEEHIDGARREADRIRAEARTAAEQIVAHAQAQAETLRSDAEKILTRARMSAEKVAGDAEAFARDTEQHAGEVLAEAQGRAEQIVRQAQENAYDIKQRAEQTYEDVVGGLTAKRQALQQQIESLEEFDHEYRARLTSFMQQQMRALWVGQPQVAADFEDADTVVGELLPAARSESRSDREDAPEHQSVT
ncbi:hypothetical protein [Dactylosporangium fulvum]|uniref:Cell division initiation protein n=1 Tax=Dactylosporangium fulvum TaxID=53359 RepID=A0ABY5WCL8_9ACTN|nr:hypothetical protein [Dactylosporangium fulvum]UWP86989.1 hypothetical protein Dfulv_23210 [Dactylosporangium fulvum]